MIQNLSRTIRLNTPVWDDGAWTPLPRLEGDASADVCVVGLDPGSVPGLGSLLTEPQLRARLRHA